ncbi:MAG: dephospho-CoA kinase [Ekhidna sp.]
MSNKPVIVGVTGGIGSGKSTICKIFEVLGCKVYYADDRAKSLMEHNEKILVGVQSLFGKEAYQETKLNRKHISERAFKDEDLLGKLNDLVHPVVKSDFLGWVSENRENGILLKEAALLFENGSYKDLDSCILVVSDEETRIRRVLSRDLHRDEQGVRDIIGKQMSDEEKRPLANFIIDNNGEASVIQQVLEIHSKLS